MELKAIVLLNITLNPFLNPFYVCIDDSLLAGLVLQIFKVRFVVHEIVFTVNMDRRIKWSVQSYDSSRVQEKTFVIN